MSYVWWSLILLLIFTGLAGTVLPFIPGTSIILAGAVLHHFTIDAGRTSWWTLAGLTALTALSYLVDLASSTVGAKWAGATKWGALGGIIGTIVGLFHGLVGVFVFPLIGVMLGELLGGKQLLPAWKSTVGTLLGTGAGLILRFLIGVAMVGWFLLAVL